MPENLPPVSFATADHLRSEERPDRTGKRAKRVPVRPEIRRPRMS